MTRFWDASVVIPLLVREPTTSLLLTALKDDRHMIVWWGTRVECNSALARRGREGVLQPQEELEARSALDSLGARWSEVQPTDRVRSTAERLLVVHPLRAADALQLASALVWSDGVPGGRVFVCRDSRLREAARKEGFTVQPTESSLHRST
jgi:predicted nucleic acid-binding protein